MEHFLQIVQNTLTLRSQPSRPTGGDEVTTGYLEEEQLLNIEHLRKGN